MRKAQSAGAGQVVIAHGSFHVGEGRHGLRSSASHLSFLICQSVLVLLIRRDPAGGCHTSISPSSPLHRKKAQ